MAATCVECGGPKAGRKKRCEPCIARWYYATPAGTLVRRSTCWCGEPRDPGLWYCEAHRVILVLDDDVPKERKRRNLYLQANYGITQRDYEGILAKQGGGCAICSAPPQSNRSLDVDHCHRTGAIRGLLCVRCNQQLLPIAKDNAKLLRAAADYLVAPPHGWAPEPEYLPADLRPHHRKTGDDRPLLELPPWMGKKGRR